MAATPDVPRSKRITIHHHERNKSLTTTAIAHKLDDKWHILLREILTTMLSSRGGPPRPIQLGPAKRWIESNLPVILYLCFRVAVRAIHPPLLAVSLPHIWRRTKNCCENVSQAPPTLSVPANLYVILSVEFLASIHTSDRSSIPTAMINTF